MVSCVKNAIYFVSVSGNLKLLQWLIGIYDKFHKIACKIFEKLCENGHTVSATNVYESWSKYIVSSNRSFSAICNSGYLSTAKFYHGLFPQCVYVVDKCTENIFIRGDLAMAMWIQSTFPDVFHQVPQSLLVLACRDGHIELASWFASILEHISTDIIDQASYYSLSYGNIFRWLMTLYDESNIYILIHAAYLYIYCEEDYAERRCRDVVQYVCNNYQIDANKISDQYRDAFIGDVELYNATAQTKSANNI